MCGGKSPKGVMKILDNDDLAFEVEFMTCVIDKADNLVVVDCDSHFSDFVGVHPSKIKQGKLFLHDVLVPKERENIMRCICKKNSPYIYFNFYLKNKEHNYIYVHCTGQNVEGTTLCRLTMADVSRSVEKSEKLKETAKEMNNLIDLVTGGVCLFKVNKDMHFEPLYLNSACCRFFDTTKENYKNQIYRLDELIYPDDRSLVFQAIGNSMATKKPIDIEIRINRHKNEFIWVKMNSAIQRYDSDKCPVFHAIFTDITRVKQEEEKADRQTDTMVSLFKNLPGPLFCTSLEEPFKLDVVSEDFIKLLGFTRKELFERYNGDLANLISAREIVMATHAIETQSQTGNVTKTTYSLKIKGGKHLVVVERRKIIESPDGKKSTIGMVRDITSMHLDEDFDI